MKRLIFFLFLLPVFAPVLTTAQGADSAQQPKAWNIEVNGLFYFVPDNSYVLPIIKADRKKLHLEARYNYEDFETFSFFGGYNFSGGKKLQYTITPMLGFATGNSDGIAPGLEMNFDLGKFSLYSENEYLFELNDSENSFFYNWSELTFAPTDWMWFGVSVQRLKSYQTDLDVQRGATLGFAIGNLELSGYYFNPFSSEQFGIISLALLF